MVRQTTKVIVAEVLGAVLLLVTVAAAVFAIMLSNGPVELGMFRDDVERALTNARDGRQVSVEMVTLQWSPSERRLFIVANNVAFMDANQVESGRAERAEITLDAGAVFLGEVEVLRVHLERGWLNLRNIAPNTWSLAGDPLPEIPMGVLPQTPQEWLDRTNSVLGSVLGGLEGMQGSLHLETLSLDDMEVRYVDIEGNEVGRFENFAGGFDRSATDISLHISGEGGGVGLPGQVSISIDTLDGYKALRADVSVNSWPISDLARRFKVAGFQDGGFKANISLGASVSGENGLEQIDVKLDREAGVLSFPMGEEILENIELDLSYLVQDDAIAINALDVKTNRLEAAFTGRLANVLSETELLKLDLSSDQVNLDITEVFSDAWILADIDMSAQISDDFKTITFERLQLTAGGGVIQASGVFDWGVEVEDGQIPFSLDVAAELSGAVGISAILRFWPERLGNGARRFIADRILEGTVTEANVALTMRPDSMAEGHLRDTDILVNFSYKDGEVKFLDNLPPVSKATGTGRLTGNSFSVNAVTSEYEDWHVDRIDVDFPALNPRGEPFIVKASGSGPALTIMKSLADSQLKLQERTGFDPERVSGDATVVFEMSRPALSTVPFEDTVINVQGTIKNAGLKNAIGSFDLVEGTAQVDLTNERIIITGHGELGEAPVQFTWRDALMLDDAPADLSATAILTPDVLNSVGLVGRAYLSGEIPVEMQGKIGTRGLGEASFAFDLQEARIDIDEIGWIKPAGQPARATLTYSGDMTKQVSAVRLVSDTARLDGDVLLGPDGRLEVLTLRNLYIENRADVSGELIRDEDGAAKLTLTGKYLDVSPFIGDLGGVGGEVSLVLSMDASVERLRLRRGLELSNATLSIVSDTDGLKLASAKGETSAGKPLEAYFSASTSGGPAVVSLSSGDAGFLAGAFLGVDFISGGTLELTGTLAKGDQPIKLLAKIEDARLQNAPFFTQVLSLASLRGLTDTLAGDGVLFSKIEAPITIGGGRYIIDGARASGPALGLTVNGWVAIDGSGIELDGVLVPSFGVNSLLGGIPVIGDLFVGRQGEGIFSITYSVRGTLERAQVAVNPLSAVTPGILRRIFENPSDTSIPDGIAVDPNLKPPTPKLPDLPDDEYIAPTPGGGG